MLKIHIKAVINVIMASIILTLSGLKFIDIPLLTMCVVIRTQTSNVYVFRHRKIKSLRLVLCRYVLKAESTAT